MPRIGPLAGGNFGLAGDELAAGSMDPLLGSSITYRIALGPLTKVALCSLREGLPSRIEPFDDGVGKVPGFALHLGAGTRG